MLAASVKLVVSVASPYSKASDQYSARLIHLIRKKSGRSALGPFDSGAFKIIL